MDCMWWMQSYNPFEALQHLGEMVSNCFCSTIMRLTIVIVTIVVVVIVVAVVELNAGCAERNDLPGVVCLAHARELIAVSVEAPVALV